MQPLTAAHDPLEHIWPEGHTRPQVPQLFASRWTSVHTPPQRAQPVMQPLAEQTPAEHARPAGHTIPQPPQLLVSRTVSVHTPLQRTKPVGHAPASSAATPQVPAEHA